MARPKRSRGTIREVQRQKGPVWVADNLGAPGLRRKKACPSFEEAERTLAGWILEETGSSRRVASQARAMSLEQFAASAFFPRLEARARRQLNLPVADD